MNQPEMAGAKVDPAIQQWAMLISIYVEALLTDPKVADQVWELWNIGLISDQSAAIAWFLIAETSDGRTNAPMTEAF